MQNFKKQFSLYIVLCVAFLDEMGQGLVYPMFSSMLFMSEGPLFGLSTSDAVRGAYLGVLLAMSAIAGFLSGPILGTLSDQKGRRPIYLFSLTIAILGYSLSILGVWLQSLLLLLCSRFMVGVALGNMGVANATVADLSDKDTKAKNFGLFAMASGLGFMLGPFLGGIFSQINFMLPFVFAGVAVLLNLLFIFLFFQESHEVKKASHISFLDGIINLKKGWTLKDLRVLFFLAICFCLGWSFFYEFIAVTLISVYQFDTAKVGVFYAVGSFCYAVSSGVLIRPFLKRCHKHAIVFYALGFLGILVCLFHFFLGSFLIWLYLAVINFLAALIYPIYTTIISDAADKDTQGEILGVFQSLQMMSFALSPLIGGLFIGIKIYMPLLLGGFSMLLGALVLGVALNKKIFARKIKQFQTHLITTDSLKIHTQCLGDTRDPACLLIAGAMASERFWNTAFCQELVDKGFFVIRYDHRDSGESSKLDWDKERYNMKDLAHDAIAILDNYDIDKAYFVGHSMGGYVCQQIALDFPKRVHKMAIISAGPLGAKEEPLSNEEKVILDRTWKLMLQPHDTSSVEAHVKSFMPAWHYFNGEIELDEEEAVNYTRDLLTRGTPKIKSGNNHEILMKELMATVSQRSDLLTKIEVPILIIHGYKDYLILPREAHVLAKGIADSKLEIILKMGHVFFNRDLQMTIVKIIAEYFKC